MSLTVAPVPAPEPGAAPTELLRACSEVLRRADLALYGYDDLADTPETMAVGYAARQYRDKVMLVATDGGRAVGVGSFGLPLADNRTVAEGFLYVDPDADHTLVSKALWEDARPRLLAAGRRTVQLWSGHRGGEPPPRAGWVVPRTGVGRLPRDTAATSLQDLGFTLEQVERHSVLEVADGLGRAAGLAEQAREVAGTAYEVLSWAGTTPVELRDGMAELCGRMSTDAPSGELELEGEEWDGDRVVEDDRVTREAGMLRVTTVARHASSGDLVAYTQIDHPTDKPAVGYQEATLVHADHRGHRLGMLVKAVNLTVLAEHAPTVRRIHTWNAGENAHMLAINVPLGFREESLEGGWQLTGLGTGGADGS